MTSRVVCISQTTGSLGEDVARLVSKGLGFRYVDEEIVTRAAEKGDLDQSLVAEIERRQTFFSSFLRLLDRGVALDAMTFTPENPPQVLPEEVLNQFAKIAASDDFKKLIRDAVREIAAEGEVVIVSHAASMALTGMKGLLRVLVTASPETRAKRLQASNELGEPAAQRMVRDTDKGRADYFKRFYKISAERETHYDLVVNTDVLTPERGADLIVQAARG